MREQVPHRGFQYARRRYTAAHVADQRINARHVAGRRRRASRPSALRCTTPAAARLIGCSGLSGWLPVPVPAAARSRLVRRLISTSHGRRKRSTGPLIRRCIAQQPAMCANMELPAANGSLQAVHFAHKFEHKAGRWFAPYLIRRISLLDIAPGSSPLHDRLLRSLLPSVMGHEYAGKFQFFMQLTQPATQLFTHLRIQRAKRFIKQQNLRFYSKRTRQRHTLFLPAGKLRRITIRQMRKLDHLQQFLSLSL